MDALLALGWVLLFGGAVVLTVVALFFIVVAWFS